uniref:Gamma-glutamylcyclotransferase family protein n=1 Tax=Palpitomonas bilix TaxID=652834 RepID=A0A7S3LU12_9EUKA|mmetsp:Transcript_46790/g.120592  ORF Transcript_46790/g.120592 Transcript_46790/m.120592 type:complete len:162 (+) Transcript_46790:185-670(+)
MSSARPHLVFVYGTLKRGFFNHHLLQKEGAVYKCDGITAEEYPLRCDKYFVPFLLNDAGSGKKVRGEVYSVTDAVLADLDELEKVPIYYERKVVKVEDAKQNENEAAFDCFVYFRTSSAPSLSSPHSNGRVFAEYAIEDHRAHYVPRHQREELLVVDEFSK